MSFTINAPNLSVLPGRSIFSVPSQFISSPGSYHELSSSILHETADSDFAIFFTSHPHENNYFWHEVGNKAIISFWGWERLTNLPISNGAVFFICAVVLQGLRLGIRHYECTGCINDFWIDKSDIDLGMRSGTICATCQNLLPLHGARKYASVINQIQIILGHLRHASSQGLDICDYWVSRSKTEEFDVFLCHNSKDKPAVRELNMRLKSAGIRTWLDEEQLPPGSLWQEILEEQIGSIRTAAVLVGESGFGPWQDVETRAFLAEFARRKCRVIPSALVGCPSAPQLPLFLSQFTWVDFREPDSNPFEKLMWGITGIKQ